MFNTLDKLWDYRMTLVRQRNKYINKPFFLYRPFAKRKVEKIDAQIDMVDDIIATLRADIKQGNHDGLINLQKKISNQKMTIRTMQESLELKNKSLDALNMVWCSGGCDYGIRRYSEMLSEASLDELLKLAEIHLERLKTWIRNHKYRKKHQKVRTGEAKLERK